MMIRSSSSVAPGSTQGTRQAFTLVEVLIAVAISAIIFASVYAGISNCYNILQGSRTNLRATQIMVSQLEGVRLCAWGSGTNLYQLFNPAIIPASFTNYFYPVGLNGTTNMGIPYYGTMTVTQLPSSGQPSTSVFGGTIPSYATNMALVTVSVTWTNGLGGDTMVHTRHMTTLVAEYGIQNYVIQY